METQPRLADVVVGRSELLVPRYGQFGFSVVEDPHKRYEPKQVICLIVSFGLIALMAAGVMLPGAVQAGLLGARR